MVPLVFEWIDRVQDIMTLIGTPVAIWLLLKVYLNSRRSG
jgi:hypothetical protein